MPDPDSLKIRINQIGGPQRTWLELKGAVLIYHARSWAASFSAYIPVEWVTVSRHKRQQATLLLRNLLMLMVTGGVGLAIIGLALQPEEGGAAPAVTNPLLRIAAITIGMVALTVAAWFALRAGRAFFERHPSTLLQVEDSDMAIEFWDNGRDDEVKQFMAQLDRLKEGVKESTAYPIKAGHARRHVRPFRAVVMKTLLITLFLLFPVKLLAGYMNRPEFMLILLLPALVYFGRYGLEHLLRRAEPKAFQRGMRHFHRGEFEAAAAWFRTLLESHPDHEHGLILGTQSVIMLERFEEAFSYCQRLRSINPELAETLQEDLWALKRMQERMQVTV